jgi:hypothetical protein
VFSDAKDNVGRVADVVCASLTNAGRRLALGGYQKRVFFELAWVSVSENDGL